MQYNLSLPGPQMRLVLTALACTAAEMRALHAEMLAAAEQVERQVAGVDAAPPEPTPEPEPEALWYPPDTDGWVEHFGGGSPVPEDTRVEILLLGERERKRYTGFQFTASTVGWGRQTGNETNWVVAYRIVEG